MTDHGTSDQPACRQENGLGGRTWTDIRDGYHWHLTTACANMREPISARGAHRIGLGGFLRGGIRKSEGSALMSKLTRHTFRVVALLATLGVLALAPAAYAGTAGGAYEPSGQ